MSNDIRVTNTVVIPTQYIDVNRLYEDIERVNSQKRLSANADLKKYMIWWFLGEDNVFADTEEVEIDLGNHRSTHTFRDLKQTLWVLGQYINEPQLVFPLQIEDQWNPQRGIQQMDMPISSLNNWMQGGKS